MSPAESSQPIFLSVAAAVADAQQKLDEAAGTGKPRYSIPRAEAELSFRMQFDSERRILFFFRRAGESSRASHRLRFTVLATPDRPATVPGRPPAIEIRLPPYLLPAENEREIGAAAERAAGAASRGSGDDTGLVCFRLSAAGRYLVVQVAEKEKNDRLYLFDSTSQDSAPADRLLYSTYRELFTVLRAARRKPQPATYLYDLGAELEWGWDQFDDFLMALWERYREAVRDLSARQPAGDPPMFYHVDDFEGDFFYSAWKPKSAEPSENAFDAAEHWIHNRVAVRYASRHPARIDLVASEFVLAGEARAKLLELLAGRAEDLAEKYSDLAGEPVDAAEFLQAKDDVLILLSYEDLPPTKGFLAVWPAAQGDFLFTFDSDGERLTDGPDAHAFARAGDEAFRLKSSAYKVIHNFFRAIRLWRNRKLRTA